MRQPTDLLRFARGERWAHHATAALMVICIATAAILYIGPLSAAVGYRADVEWVHVIAGICLPAPFLIALLSKAFRADAGLLNRFSPSDWKWFRSSQRWSGRLPVGKFNAGQKLNANFQLGAISVMLLTGCVMRFANGSPIAWRTGATFVHDWVAYAIVAVVLGHIYMALRDPVALRGMRTGYVPASWAESEHSAWAEELNDAEPRPAASPRPRRAAR